MFIHPEKIKDKIRLHDEKQVLMNRILQLSKEMDGTPPGDRLFQLLMERNCLIIEHRLLDGALGEPAN